MELCKGLPAQPKIPHGCSGRLTWYEAEYQWEGPVRCVRCGQMFWINSYMYEGHLLGSCGIKGRNGWYDMDPRIMERIIHCG